MTDNNTADQRATATETGFMRNSPALAPNPVPNERTTFMSWPVLGIALALLCTLVWCGFLAWLLIRIF
jgi:flagellar biogenesis protein FliO